MQALSRVKFRAPDVLRPVRVNGQRLRNLQEPELHPGCCGPRPSQTTSRVALQNARPRARDLPTCSIQQTELCYCYYVEKGKYLPGAIAVEFMDHAQLRSCE